ncbi:hypothetical protein KR52_03910 [Synechococcus sp. KORDI-52]|uniref:DUF2752 domain-containing protein n=1 Tax=Synechococcus sp. KORDI-52 TaxID=585425 RepID=UPI0004E094FA|nr:DUF2752 domain-containing protein [Synechococcus sp. KORDI-52]AII48301.1 hypothetical protein KR52_03910 [Synechococcus sp. KORDI-52]
MLPATLTGTLWLKGLHPGLPGLSCPLRELTGVPCPTCFLTRATAAALTGDLNGSLQWHLFGPVTAVGLLVWSIQALKQRRIIPKGLPVWPLPIIGGALISYWLLRLSTNNWPGG